MSKVNDAKAIFFEALDKKSHDELMRYLDEACGGNAELRCRVEDLLRAHQDVGNFLGGSSTVGSTSEQLMSEKPGTQIGPYKLLQQIGEGGFGVVFMAEQQEPFTRKVALKVIKPGMDTRQVVARFEAERQALAVMDHPNIAKVLDAGTTGSGRPYFAMELVHGQPITQFSDEQQLTALKRLELFIPICQAVQHAHQKGLIHRDIKPSNILVALYDGRPVPKVIDFGVAKATGQRLTEKTMFTQFGQIVGTLEYMSPEQAERNQLDIDTRSDVYSLGVVLYELLTGQTPFDRQRLRSAAFDEMLRIIREEEPPAPSRRLSSSQSLDSIAAKRGIEPAKLNTLVRGELDWIVMKAMEKDRARRYDTAGRFAEDIEHYLADEPVAACPPSRLYKLRKYVRRNKAATLSAAAIVMASLLAVVGITASLWHARSVERHAAQVATRQSQVATRQSFEYGINLAYEAWNRGNRGEFEQIIQKLDKSAREWERRGFEWRYLRARYQELTEVETVEVSEGAQRISYHPNGTHMAIGCGDGTVAIRDCHSGRPILRLPDGLVGKLVAFSPKGSFLATRKTVDDKNRLQLWRFPSFEEIDFPTESFEDLSYLTMSPDESRIAGVRPDGVVEIRALHTGELLTECDAVDGPQTGLAFSPDARFLLSFGNSPRGPEIRLWTVTGQLLDSASCPEGTIHTPAFVPDGSAFVVSSYTEAIRYDVTDDGIEDSGRIAEASIWSLAISHTGLLALGCSDHTVRIWDLAESREIQRLLHHSLVDELAFSPEGRELAAGTRDDIVHVWPSYFWERTNAVRAAEHAFPPLAVSSRGDVATTEVRGDRHVFKVWNLDTGAERNLWGNSEGGILGAAFSPKGRLVASANSDGEIRIGSVETGRVLLSRCLPGEWETTCVAFSPDGRFLVSGSHGGRLLYWDVKKALSDPNEYEPVEMSGPRAVTSLDFSRSGQLAIGGGRSWSHVGKLMLWDVNEDPPKLIWETDYPETVRCVAFSPDGSSLAVTFKFSAGVVHVLDATTREVRFEFKSHSDKVTTLLYSPDGTRLITGSDDGTVRFWDLRYSTPVGTLRIGAAVRNLAMPDGNTLLTLSRDGWLRRWRASP